MENKLKEEIIEKIFYPKDIFFNNGIVNLYEYLTQKNIEILQEDLANNSLKLKFNKSDEIKIFNSIISEFIINNRLVIFTKNDRLYWDKNRNDFVKDKRVDIPSGVRNEKKNILFREKLNKLGFTKEEIRLKYDNYPDKKINSFSQIVSKAGDVIIHKEHNDYISQYINEVLWKDQNNEISLDSKIHTFEWGPGPFADMLPNKGEKLDKWDALIYWFGTRIKRFYNSNFYLYINSKDLEDLFNFKKELKIDDEKIKYKDDKTEEIKAIPTNIDFRNQLYKNDGIKNPYFYISNSEAEFELKFFMYLFSLIYHIEDSYEKELEERRKNRKEKLYETLKYITFFTYTQEGDMKSSLNEYSKAYKLVKFLKILKEYRIEKDNKNIFTYLSELITTLNLSKSNKELNLNIKSFANNLLNFKNLRKNYLEASFDVLKNDKGRLGRELYIFENLYLKEIKKEDLEMDLHRKSKIIGEGIGNFEAQIDDKNLLFTLRNIKNHKQLISYFKNFKFEVLKNQEKAKLNSEFLDSLRSILEELEQKTENWELARDYIAIYAIDKYKSSSYAMKKI
ncbi:MAG: hypothetical protein COZ07_03360 [Candidatus Infernicultor aquiphilus]|uniref:Uncharacterized protein n=1 Tax=Candidatus Infernicultor aquiphilus TaxID=1805029 RepID=A0A2M7PR71_9BACT|nr:MAG: hypothetical protein COT11_02565 [Candidatus Atribacteria bacterium CG08_land_8_20_14_0_20_33_29]PIW12327.1 MAG: hypothetical protein COW35_02070 [Candidatus Atribacteria bacterium CG17_big_fil_post_rev_8_21_14_2_50_34_11]PIX34792.1 MAG: hypothetical protein COZ58_02610 [Candidatus Atribacteria bacterium CG_4_8_14_3_um_filter_34_18]PIY33119.1 MAG: hypothetical protein COZ07_03360 [Candidatus Atribacteria bacterium CG_4_10_14_3_um_filter_34_13]